MTGIILKIIFCPIAVAAVSFVLPTHIYYPSFYYPLFVGLVIALVGHAMEIMLLQSETVWLSTMLDIGAAALITYFSQYLLDGSYVTFWGAFITALVVGATEHLQHSYLVSSGKTRKGD